MGVRKSCGAEGGRVCTVDGDAGRSGRRGKGELGHHDHDEVGDCARRVDAGARRRDAGPAEDFVEERAPLGILEGGSVAPSDKNKSTHASFSTANRATRPSDDNSPLKSPHGQQGPC